MAYSPGSSLFKIFLFPVYQYWHTILSQIYNILKKYQAQRVLLQFLIRNYLSSFLNVFFIFFCLIFILNLLTELEFFKQTEVKSTFPFYLSLINTPMFVFEMFPFVFLISTQFFFNNLFNNNEMNIFKYSGLKNTKIFSILISTTFFTGIIIISIFYNLSSNLKNLYLGLKSNYTEDKKYLAVITNNGLWIKDIYDKKILMINAGSFNLWRCIYIRI